MGFNFSDETGKFSFCSCDKCELYIPWNSPMFRNSKCDFLCDNCYVEELMSSGEITEIDECYEIDGIVFDDFQDLIGYLKKNYDYVDKEKLE